MPPVRVLFVVVAAIVAASVTDPIVEAFSNSGLFGAGTFTDGSNADVLPALLVALAIVALSCIVAVRRLAGRPSPAWLRGCARSFARIELARVLPAVFALQILALFVMETGEQLVIAHHTLGGTIWLGGPPALSLLFHALGCIVATAVLARLLRSASAVVARAVVHLLAFLAARSGGAPCIARPQTSAARATIQCSLRPVLGRAPPLPAA
jgi:uncharacterized membrane protein YhaH (DUF805 family)